MGGSIALIALALYLSHAAEHGARVAEEHASDDRKAAAETAEH
jgi:hypothetical protein